MAKKKSNSLLKYLPVIAGVLGFVALVLFAFLPMVTNTSEAVVGDGVTVYKYSGFGMLFGSSEFVATYTSSGYKLASMNGTFEAPAFEVEFNTLAFVAFALVLVGAAVSVAVSFVKGLAKNKLVSLVAGLLMIVGAVLMFTVKNSAAVALGAEDFVEYLDLGAGAIVGGIVAAVAGLTSVASAVLKK